MHLVDTACIVACVNGEMFGLAKKGFLRAECERYGASRRCCEKTFGTEDR